MSKQATQKPQVQLSGEDGNIFFIEARCARAMKDDGSFDRFPEFQKELHSAPSYDHALRVVMKWFDVS